MNKLDELTDINFRLICQSKSKSMYSVNFVDENGEQLMGQICSQLVQYMEENGLIQINGENCHLNLKSEHICESGWIKHLKSKEEDRFEEYTLSVLENLRNGKEGKINKSESDEAVELLVKLRNTGIAQPIKNGVIIPLKNRKLITKLIELESWDKFQNWYDGQNSNNSIIYDFSGSTIGQLNQSKSLKVEKTEIKQTNHPKTKEKQHNAILSFFAKFWWQILIPLLIGILLIMIEKGIINIGI